MSRRASSRWGWLLAAGLIAAVQPIGAGEPESLHLERVISLPSVSGRIDHLALDSTGTRLYVSALGNDTVEVVDLAAGRRLAPFAKCPRPTGIAFLSRRQRVAVACSGDATLRLYDASSRALVAELGGLEDADNVRVDASDSRLYVGIGSGAIAVIDLEAVTTAGRIVLPAHPEAFQLDRRSGRLFVNVPGASEIASLSLSGATDRQRWSTHGLLGNYAMALDEARGRLWVAFRRPARLASVDPVTGAFVRTLPICGDADDLFLDRQRERVYVACGEGFVDVVQIGVSGIPQLAARVPTRRGARTALFSEASDSLYVAVPRDLGRDAEVRVLRPR